MRENIKMKENFFQSYIILRDIIKNEGKLSLTVHHFRQI